jgi:hypothetical protein
VFERLGEDKREVPRGTIKITVEMPAGYTGMMPRDLLVRDHAELERIAREGNDDESDELSDQEEERKEVEAKKERRVRGENAYLFETAHTRAYAPRLAITNAAYGHPPTAPQTKGRGC